jgi:hypothetical protein
VDSRLAERISVAEVFVLIGSKTSRTTTIAGVCAGLLVAALGCGADSMSDTGRSPATTAGAGTQPSAGGSGAAAISPPNPTGGVGLAAAGASAPPSAAGSHSAGSGAAGAGANSASSATLPCAVSKTLVSKCQSCHGAMLVGGAPMSLVTFADFKKPAVTQPTLTVGQLALMRLNDTAKPMPPGGTISADEKKTLTDWLSAGAPAAAASEDTCMTGTAVAAVPAEYKIGLIAKPGETCYDLPTHAAQMPGDKTPYSVIPGEHYEQFYFKVPWPAGVVATRFGAKFDNVPVLHHWLLFTTNKAASQDGTHETTIGTQLGDQAQLLGGWAVGGENVEFPSDMGLKLPESGMLNVQWHFYNQGGAAADDSSKVQVCTVPAAMRKNLVGMTWLGTENFNGPLGMPAHQMSTFGGTCPNDSAAPITIWAVWPHMHKLGRHMTSVVKRANGTMETVFDKPFDFNHQVHYPQSPMIVLQPGETITSTCTFDNTTNNSVAFGPSSEQEMCYQFAFSYPAGALDNGVLSLIGASNTCW